jgi:hypothetical protein
VGTSWGSSFIGEKVGDEDALFRAVAPAVDAGSYIQVSSDGGERLAVGLRRDAV